MFIFILLNNLFIRLKVTINSFYSYLYSKLLLLLIIKRFQLLIIKDSFKRNLKSD